MAKTFGNLYSDFTAATASDQAAGDDVTAKQAALSLSVQAKAAADGTLTAASTTLAGKLAGTPGLLLSDGTLLSTGPDGKLQPPVKVPTLSDVAFPDDPTPSVVVVPDPTPTPTDPTAAPAGDPANPQSPTPAPAAS